MSPKRRRHRSQPSATRSKTPEMNKNDARLHRKSQASAVAAFHAATPVQNGGKIKICTMPSLAPGTPKGKRPYRHHERRSWCTRLPILTSTPLCMSKSKPKSYIFRFFHHLEQDRRPRERREARKPLPSAQSVGADTSPRRIAATYIEAKNQPGGYRARSASNKIPRHRTATNQYR